MRYSAPASMQLCVSLFGASVQWNPASFSQSVQLPQQLSLHMTARLPQKTGGFFGPFRAPAQNAPEALRELFDGDFLKQLYMFVVFASRLSRPSESRL